MIAIAIEATYTIDRVEARSYYTTTRVGVGRRTTPRRERGESGRSCPWWEALDLDSRAGGFLYYLSLCDLFCTSCHNAHQCMLLYLYTMVTIYYSTRRTLLLKLKLKLKLKS